MDNSEHLTAILLVCLISGVVGGKYCDGFYSYCTYGCCDDYTYGYKREVCCDSNVIESYSNVAVIIGASIGGVILFVAIVSIVVCVVCCKNKNRALRGHMIPAQPMVFSGAYPVQTSNMQPGINQWQQQQTSNQPTNMQPGVNQWQPPTSSNQTTNMTTGVNHWQPPPPYDSTMADNYKLQQRPPDDASQRTNYFNGYSYM